MRTVEWTAQFKRDYKRERRGKHQGMLDAILLEASQMLTTDQPLPTRYRDHFLSGNYSKHRECHLKPDLLLIYVKPDDAVLRFVRLGSHSELF